jgi:hypothetical protein
MSDRSAGCRGVSGPVPRPLWMSSLSLGAAACTRTSRSACWEGRPHTEQALYRYVKPAPILFGVMTNSLPTDSILGMQARSRLTRWQWVRLVGNMVNLTTPIGLLIATIGGARIRRGPRGLFVGEGYRLGFPVASAFTIGSVITTDRTWPELLRRTPQLFEHEERHTWQYLWCIGLPFYPAYGVCLVWSVLRTGDLAARNFFERNAGLASGGYQDMPVRPIGENIRAVIGQLRTRRTS